MCEYVILWFKIACIMDNLLNPKGWRWAVMLPLEELLTLVTPILILMTRALTIIQNWGGGGPEGPLPRVLEGPVVWNWFQP